MNLARSPSYFNLAFRTMAFTGGRSLWRATPLAHGFPAIEYTPQELAKFVKDFLDAAGVGRAHVVGTDTGQGIGVAFAGTYSERTDRLVLEFLREGGPSAPR